MTVLNFDTLADRWVEHLEGVNAVTHPFEWLSVSGAAERFRMAGWWQGMTIMAEEFPDDPLIREVTNDEETMEMMLRMTDDARSMVAARPSAYMGGAVTVRQDRKGRLWQVHRLTKPGLWRHVWTMYRGRRLWALRWFATHRRIEIGGRCEHCNR